MLVSVLCFMGFSSFLYIGRESAFYESKVSITAFDGESDVVLVNEELADETRDGVSNVVNGTGTGVRIDEVVALGGHGGQLLFFDDYIINSFSLFVNRFFQNFF